MKITLELYGRLADEAGCSEHDLVLDDDSTVESALSRAADVLPGLAHALDGVAFAVGSRLVTRNDRLEDGDTLSFLPPVSGG